LYASVLEFPFPGLHTRGTFLIECMVCLLYKLLPPVFHTCHYITSTFMERRCRCKFDQRLFAGRVVCRTLLSLYADVQAFRKVMFTQGIARTASNTLPSILWKGWPNLTTTFKIQSDV